MLEGSLDEEERKDERFEVWPENWASVQIFTAVCTQWRVAAGFGVVYIGLDYGAVESAMNMRHVRRADRPRLFEDIGVMEIAALAVLNRRRRDG